MRKKITENNENIALNLKEKFWENILDSIKKEVSDLQIVWLKNINSVLWWKFFNSCFHPDEFGIWSYRVSSAINQLEISDWIWIQKDDIFIDYLDTITSWWIKWFPNLKLSKDFNWKNLFSVIEEKWNSLKNFSAKEKIKIWNKIFDEFLKISQLEKSNFWDNVLDFFKWILKETWFYEKISEWIKNFPDQEKNLENKIISFLFREKILEKSLQIKEIFLRNLMQKKYENWFLISEIYWEYQNAVLSIFVTENFWNKKEILEEKEVLKNWKINFQNSYKNEKNIELFSQWVEKILEDENLWKEFFYTFFEKLLEKSWWKPVKIMDFYENSLKKDLFIYKENWKIDFYKWKIKNPEKISEEDWFNFLSWRWLENYNLSWNFTIFLMWISWSFHIWSERWYRELVAESVEEFFEKKWEKTEKLQK